MGRRYPPLPPARGGMTTTRGVVLVTAVSFSPCAATGFVRYLGSLPGPWVLLVPVLGVWFAAIPGGLWDVARFRRRSRRLARYASEPWFADHAWDPRGTRRTGWRRSTDQELWVTFAWFAFFSLGGLVALATRAPWGPVTGVALASIAAWILVSTIRDVSRGAVDVVFTRFPYHPGDPVELHVGCAPGGPSLEDCVLTLRRIEERCGSRWTWRPKVTPTYADQRVPTVSPGPDQYVVVTFDVPEGSGGTCLSALAPSYWELVIDAQVDGRRFLDRFLIPVYERPR